MRVTSIVGVGMSLLGVGCGTRSPELTVINEATQPLQNVEVRAGGQIIWSGSLEPGQEATTQYEPTRDSDFVLSGSLGDAPVQVRPLGYTERGDGQHHVLTVSADGTVHYRLGR